MSRNKDMTTVSFAISIENRDVLGEYVTQKGYKVISDYLRNLVEADMHANGVKIDLSVDRGGYRIKGSGKSEEE